MQNNMQKNMQEFLQFEMHHEVIFDDKKKFINKKKKNSHEPSELTPRGGIEPPTLRLRSGHRYSPGQGGTDNIRHLIFVFILPKLKMIKSALRPNTIKNRIK